MPMPPMDLLATYQGRGIEGEVEGGVSKEIDGNKLVRNRSGDNNEVRLCPARRPNQDGISSESYGRDNGRNNVG